MKAATLALRDELSSAMQTNSLPLSTDQLAALCQPLCRFPRCDAYLHAHHHAGWLTNECRGDVHLVTTKRIGYQVYPHLRALEKAGLCSRLRLDSDNRVFWQWTGPMPEALEQLEEMWALTS